MGKRQAVACRAAQQSKHFISCVEIIAVYARKIFVTDHASTRTKWYLLNEGVAAGI